MERSEKDDEEKTETDSMYSVETDVYTEINLRSSAWPKNEQVQTHSKVHQIIRQKLKFVDKSKIVYKQLRGPDIEEIRKLHNEWFPLEYQDNYFRRIYKTNCVAIGAFYPMEEDYIGRDGKLRKKKKKHIILGAILTKINRDNDDINEIYRAR